MILRKDEGYGAEGGSPIWYPGMPLDEQRRRHDAALNRAARATDHLYAHLEHSKIDIYDLSAEQEDIIDQVKNDLIKKATLGTLTKEEEFEILYNLRQHLYSDTKSPNGDPYPIVMEIQEKHSRFRTKFPELGTYESNVLGEKELQLISEFDGYKPAADDKEGVAVFEAIQQYKEEVYWDAIEDYNSAIRNGEVKQGEFQKFYDQAVLKVYENCTKPVPIETLVDGRKQKLSVPIGELISPDDDSFGAQVSREAMRLVGLPYKHQASEIVPGVNGDYEIDCSRLVSWALAQINSDWKKDTISTAARYQPKDIKLVWSLDNDKDIDYSELQVGDTLFWQGDETDKIVHTAIYIGEFGKDNHLMIEAGKRVGIVNVRVHTYNDNGEDSTLVQINRMSEKVLNDNRIRNIENKYR